MHEPWPRLYAVAHERDAAAMGTTPASIPPKKIRLALVVVPVEALGRITAADAGPPAYALEELRRELAAGAVGSRGVGLVGRARLDLDLEGDRNNHRSEADRG